MIEILDKFIIKNLEIVAHRIIDNQAVIVNLKKKTLNVLNLTATQIWELADGETKLKDIIEEIYQEFEVDKDELKEDCLNFVKQMLNKGLLTLSTHPAEVIRNEQNCI